MEVLFILLLIKFYLWLPKKSPTNGYDYDEYFSYNISNTGYPFFISVYLIILIVYPSSFPKTTNISKYPS